MITVLFICRTNFVASPLAAAIFNRLAAEANCSQNLGALSRGVFPGSISRGVDRRIQLLAQSGGYDLSSHKTNEIAVADVLSADYLFALDEDSYWRVDSLMREKGIPEKKRQGLQLFTENTNQLGQREMPDPVLGECSFEQAFEVIEKFTRTVFERVARAEGLHNQK